MLRALLVICACLIGLGGAHADSRFIVVASTTSTQQSGLFGYILPLFEREAGFDVRVVALGTGQALDTARRGDADVVFVHDRAAEEKFVAEGHGVGRRDVMYNDFVLVGPKYAPAAVAGGPDIVAELRLWKLAGIDLDAVRGPWYRDAGSGMGPSLNMAASLGAYILADRGTWLSFKNRQDLAIAVEGDRRLFNQYGVMLVAPARHPHVKRELGQHFIDWLVSPAGQQAIADYRIDGEQLFFPNATD